jgi:ABC-type glycerol-3-phosphate transport system permease component
MAVHQPSLDAGTEIEHVRDTTAGGYRRMSNQTKVLLYIVGAVVTVLMLFPFYWMIVTALRPPGTEADLTFIPQPYLAFENFARAWNERPFTQFTINSTIIAVVGTALTVFLNALAGFAFAKYRFPGREALFYAVLATTAVPFHITMIPVFVTLARLNLVNTYWGVILPGVANAFGIFLVRQYMQSIPDDLLDAARIDGASELGIFFRIIIPLSKPALAVLVIFSFLGRWNDFLLPLLVLISPDMQTMPIGIASFIGEYRADWPAVMAVSLISILPTVVVFLFFQRYFVSGMAISGMKG